MVFCYNLFLHTSLLIDILDNHSTLWCPHQVAMPGATGNHPCMQFTLFNHFLLPALQVHPFCCCPRCSLGQNLTICHLCLMSIIGIDGSWVCECVSTWLLLKHFAGSGNVASFLTVSLKVCSVYVWQSGAHSYWCCTCSSLASFQHYAFTDTLSVSSWGSWLLVVADRLQASSKHAHWRA